jgi:hypothetical protein
MSELTPPDDRFGDSEPMRGEIVQPPVAGPAAPFNPFAVGVPEHINAGAVAIETGRGIAEVQGRMLLAKRFPRDSAMAYARTMQACLRIGLAKEAIYRYNRGGVVEGPSIRLAEEMARCWGNIEYGLNELARRPGESEMEAFAWDLETNVRSSQRFSVRHIRDKSDGGKTLETERDIYEVTANMGARRMRSRILAILPPELTRDAVLRCKDTVLKGGGEPLEDRIRKMMAAFTPLGVTPDMIVEYVGHPIDKITPDELVDLTGVFQSLKDNQSRPRDWFGKKKAEIPKDADPFEKATVGKSEEKSGTQSTLPDEKPDPDLPHAQALAAQFARCATAEEVEALARNPKVARDMKTWQQAKPALWKLVDDAHGARRAELTAARVP